MLLGLFDNKSIQTLVSVILVLISFLLKTFYGYNAITIVIMLLTVIVAGTPIILRAVKALRYKIIGIDSLVSIAVIGAIIIGEFWEAAAVSFLFTFGAFLEAKTIEKTRSSIKALLDMAPLTARVSRSGIEMMVKPEEVQKTESVIVKPGEKIPVDGTILEGYGFVNQSAITGEPLPLEIEKGDSCFSGSILESGYLIIRADKVGDDTSFSHIIKLVEEAQDKKAKTQAFLERFSKYYTPTVVLGSFLAFVITKDLRLALTLLVIACPGALVISAPVSIVAGIGNGAKHGVLVKGGEIMERLGKVKVIAFDKTGTLTIGSQELVAIESLSGLSRDEVLELAAIGESYSEHPLAKAIIKAADKMLSDADWKNRKPIDPVMMPGRGISFILDGKKYFAGNRRLFIENNIELKKAEEFLSREETAGRSIIILGNENEVLGCLSISDVTRPNAKKSIEKLNMLGIKHKLMLTGDNRRAAAAISNSLGLDGYYAELLPEDKVSTVQELKQKYGLVAMVGDGINDAPALAAADLGIALGAGGSDIAIETADVVLLSAELKHLAYAINLSRATVRNMRQNITFALLVAAFLLTAVIFKRVNLSLGMLIHEASVLLVIINAVRLLSFKNNE